MGEKYVIPGLGLCVRGEELRGLNSDLASMRRLLKEPEEQPVTTPLLSLLGNFWCHLTSSPGYHAD